MLTFNGNLKVYVALEPCDMRKSFHGLSAMVRNHLGLDPLSGAAYLFTNKSRQRMPFSIPIRHGDHRIPVASVLRTTPPRDPPKGTERDGGY